MTEVPRRGTCKRVSEGMGGWRGGWDGGRWGGCGWGGGDGVVLVGGVGGGGWVGVCVGNLGARLEPAEWAARRSAKRRCGLPLGRARAVSDRVWWADTAGSLCQAARAGGQVGGGRRRSRGQCSTRTSTGARSRSDTTAAPACPRRWHEHSGPPRAQPKLKRLVSDNSGTPRRRRGICRLASMSGPSNVLVTEDSGTCASGRAHSRSESQLGARAAGRTTARARRRSHQGVWEPASDRCYPTGC